MSDIRKRVGRKGTTYQVRYPSKSTKSGYAYATFNTMKEARGFVESGGAVAVGTAGARGAIRTMTDATSLWLTICKKEGLNGREPVTTYTYKNYEYRAAFVTEYPWPKDIQDLTPPDVVAFRSWLLGRDLSRDLAGKVLSTLQSIVKEMAIRGVVSHNAAAGICIRADSRYDEPVVIPSKQDMLALLSAADRLANSKNGTIENAWRRYRPMLYLAADSGMRPQEYLAAAKTALADNGIRVDRAVDGSGAEITVTKTNAGRRFIELSAHTLDLVRHYANNHAIANEHDLIFPANNGSWQSRRNWQRRGFNVACAEAGLVDVVDEGGVKVERPRYRPYHLRHFFASMLIERKTNLKKIQILMGHTNIETTLNVYGHLLEDETQDKGTDAGMLTAMLSSCGESVANTN